MIVANGKISQKPVLPVILDHPKNLAVPNNPAQQGTPNQADNSKQPTIPTTPDQPNDSTIVPNDSTQRATVSNSVTAERSVAVGSEKEATLPQTGNDNNQAKAAMGLGLTSLGTMMAMFGLKKRRHN
ncbi:LPXTG cell wall anchor domain-containing protein [Limosilactobacillus mucosae]|uniref:LPXTG cell wall anchor domain-containing protein n=1 Tax=Limosilactobacillus mucosae TaxID=97478 RepID=UPI0039932CE6